MAVSCKRSAEASTGGSLDATVEWLNLVTISLSRDREAGYVPAQGSLAAYIENSMPVMLVQS